MARTRNDEGWLPGTRWVALWLEEYKLKAGFHAVGDLRALYLAWLAGVSPGEEGVSVRAFGAIMMDLGLIAARKRNGRRGFKVGKGFTPNRQPAERVREGGFRSLGSYRLLVCLSPGHRAALEAMAAREGSSMGAVVRRLVDGVRRPPGDR